MKIKKMKRLPNSRWSMKIDETYKGCRESDRYVMILFDGKVIIYMNYALLKDKDVVAKRLVRALKRAGVVIRVPEFDDKVPLWGSS